MSKFSRLGVSVVKTLAYAAVFEFPLRLEEVAVRLIEPPSEGRLKEKDVKRVLEEELGKVVKKVQGYYLLRSMDGGVVKKRKEMSEVLERKRELIEQDANLLRQVQTIEAVVMTGSVAAGNVTVEDDLDLLLITAAGCLWWSRLRAVLLLNRDARRRRPGETEVTDKVCLNMLMSRDALFLDRHDLYTAHELVQAICLWQRNGACSELLKENSWVGEYLPFWYARSLQDVPDSRDENNRAWLGRQMEGMVRTMQQVYMQGRKTKELVTKNRAMFHPEDRKERVLEVYERKVEELGVVKSKF